jgi:DNA invertase Pin-like site-specific DNA recombinase
MEDRMKRAAIYTRVSTDKQTIENQVQALKAVAQRQGWKLVAEYNDAGVSGCKTRDNRPGLKQMVEDAQRHKFDVAMCWAIDRLGRSTIDVMGTMEKFRECGVQLYIDQQQLDTTTPTGEFVFTVMAAFANLERQMIVKRIHAGLDRAKLAGKRPGPKSLLTPAMTLKIRADLARGDIGMLKLAAKYGIGSGTIQKIKREMAA